MYYAHKRAHRRIYMHRHTETTENKHGVRFDCEARWNISWIGYWKAYKNAQGALWIVYHNRHSLSFLVVFSLFLSLFFCLSIAISLSLSLALFSYLLLVRSSALSICFSRLVSYKQSHAYTSTHVHWVRLIQRVSLWKVAVRPMLLIVCFCCCCWWWWCYWCCTV